MGQRSIADSFELLDHVISTTAGDYKLQKINDMLGLVLSDPHLLQETLRPETTLSASFFELMVAHDSDFSLVPSDEGGEISVKTLTTFSDLEYIAPNSSSQESKTRWRVYSK